MSSVHEEREPKVSDLIDSGNRTDSLVKVTATGRHMTNQGSYPKSDLRSAWGTYLATFPWQWFVTLTFNDDIHPESARKLYGRWVNYVNRQAYGSRYRKRTKGVCWALASELQVRGVLHYHALVGDVEDLNNRVSRKDARNYWYEIAGIGLVDPITHKLTAVTNYVSKYVAKGGDIELSDSLIEFRSQLTLGVS